MSYNKKVTDITLTQFVAEISDQRYPLTGMVLALEAAQAAALGEACLQISLDNQVDKLNWHDVTARIEQMVHLKNTLLEWCNQAAGAAAEYEALRTTEEEVRAQRLLCDSAGEVARLALEAGAALESFRPFVFAGVANDLEVARRLLFHIASQAAGLLKNCLHTWADEVLTQEYDPLLTELLAGLMAHNPDERDPSTRG